VISCRARLTVASAGTWLPSRVASAGVTRGAGE
jgi:hypothetical protein